MPREKPEQPSAGKPGGRAWRAAVRERNWLVFRLVPKPGGKPRKVPCHPTSLRAVSPEEAATLTHAEALAASAQGDDLGIGYLPREGSAMVGLDIDGSVGPRGIQEPRIHALTAKGYWEFSPSGTGLRGLIPRQPDGDWTRDGKGGGLGYMGSASLFFTITGRALHPGVRLLEEGVDAWPIFREALRRPEPTPDEEPARHWMLSLPPADRVAAVTDALAHIDLHELRERQGSVYAEWLEVVFAVFRCRLPEPEALLDRWSRTQPDYDPEEDWAKRRPKPREGSTVGPATLVHHAKAGGWDERPWREKVRAAAVDVLRDALGRALGGHDDDPGVETPDDADGPVLRPLSAFRSAPHIPPHVVRGMFTRGVAGTWVGPGGVSKTSVALLIGAHVAAGLPIGGREVVRGSVVLLSKEDDVGTLRFRAEALIEASLPQEARQVARDELFVGDLLGLPMDDTRLVRDTGQGVSETPMVEMLLQLLRPIRPALVILDPASAWGAGEHLVNTAEAALMFAANRIAREIDCAVVIIHHVSQAAARERTRDAYAGRGGSALADNGRFGLTHYEARAEDFEGDDADALPEGVGMSDVDDGRVTRLDTVKLSHDARPRQPMLVKRSALNPWRITLHSADEGPRLSREERVQEQVAAREEAMVERVREMTVEGAAPTRREMVRCGVLASMVGGRFPREDREAVIDRLLAKGRLRTVQVPSGGGRNRDVLALAAVVGDA